MSARLNAHESRPIGVFDSGVGGLTVLSALTAEMPQENYLYLGDTARLPYGTKSRDTVVRYALQACDRLVERGVKCLIVACNTASAAALGELQARYVELPVLGVIEPGAQAACAASATGRIAVIATEATARGGAYTRAILRHRPVAIVTTIACPLFVALAEEGWAEGQEAQVVAARYLQPLFGSGEPHPDTLVLGCTHFPALTKVIRAAVGEDVNIVDSAATTARAARELLLAGIEPTRRDSHVAAAHGTGSGTRPNLRFLATDGTERFAAVGSRFLGRHIPADDVELIDL